MNAAQYATLQRPSVGSVPEHEQNVHATSIRAYEPRSCTKAQTSPRRTSRSGCGSCGTRPWISTSGITQVLDLHLQHLQRSRDLRQGLEVFAQREDGADVIHVEPLTTDTDTWHSR
jgi:hypothetical protein